ncbi:MAG: glycosyltransferase family 4 protein [Chloroflexia bacterium]|nr:glycosyltransferase family 4 protein [Chloroflexia bacterium]
MNVLQILYYYTPHCSGVTIYAERLATHLTARGHDVTILASRHDRSYPIEQRVEGVREVRVPVAFGVSRGVVMPGFLPTAARLMREHDVVHLHLPLLEAAPLALIARATRTRLILTHHTDLVFPYGWFNRLAERGVFVSGLGGGKLADRVVTYTADRAAVSPTMRRLRAKMSVIYPPIEMPLPSDTGRASFRTRHALGDGPVIGFAGRFAEEKGCDDLLRTVPLMLDAFPTATYVFAGEYQNVVGDSLYQRSRPLLDAHRDHVRLLGVVRGQELVDFYAACNVLVLPSTNYTETFGLVQVEAMLCGTPVVASDLPGVREPITVTGMGRITPPRDVPALAAAIIEVVRNRATYTRPRDEIEHRFSMDTTVDAYERLYRGDPIASEPAGERFR